MIKKWILFLLTAYGVLLTTLYAYECYLIAHPFITSGEQVPHELRRGIFRTYQFNPKVSPPAAVILFGSGDGGWGTWEETVSHALQHAGYEVVGIDSAKYAATDYNLDILQSDERAIAAAALAPFGNTPPPLIIGGWSMGAAQAIAAAGGPHPPDRMTGVLIAAPLSRGRYGLRLSDRMNVLPTGDGTFAVADFARGMDHLRVAQWHAASDSIDSRDWLRDLIGEHREYDLPNAGHEFGRPDFLQRFVESAGWVVHGSAPKTVPGKP